MKHYGIWVEPKPSEGYSRWGADPVWARVVGSNEPFWTTSLAVAKEMLRGMCGKEDGGDFSDARLSIREWPE